MEVSLWSHVAELPDAQRYALTLRFSEQLSYADIAEVLQCPLGTVKSRIFHGFAALCERMRRIRRSKCRSSSPRGCKSCHLSRIGILLVPIKLIPRNPPRAQFDTELPDDLRILGEQLSDDARQLDARYPSTVVSPANVGSKERSSTRSPSRRIAAAVALLALGAGGATLAWRPWQFSAQAVVDQDAQSPMRVRSFPAPTVESWNSAGIQEVAVDPAQFSNRSELEMLRLQLSAFEQVIRRLQAELSRRATSEAEMKSVIQSLRDEVGQLRQQSDDRSKPTPDK